MPSDYITIVSLLIAVTAVCLTLWQNVLQRRAAQADVFLHMLDQFGSDDVFNGAQALSNLQHHESLQAFEVAETLETQRQIYKLVEFLNNTARLVGSGYLPRQRVWDLYFMVYRTAHEKLIPWWLDGQRQRSYPQKFLAFEEMCLQIADIPPTASEKYDNKTYRRYSRRYKRSHASVRTR